MVRNDYRHLDSEVVKDLLSKTQGSATLQGWNLDINTINETIQEIVCENFEDYNVVDLDVFELKEMAFHMYRGGHFNNMQFISFHETWRKGFGKCTACEFKYKLEERD